jgi:predicted  nucleic acid-binding Zn-ribbon protein
VTEAGVPPAQEKEWFALIEAASAERDAAQDELAVAKMRSTTLQKSLNLQTLELEGTNGRLTAIKDLGIELQNSLAAKEQKHTKLQDDFSKLQKHNANQNTQIATMQAQLANASGAPGYESTQEIEELKLSLGEANSYCDNRDVEVERLQAANKKLMSDIRQLRALLDAQAKESPAEAVVEVHNVINKILTAGFSPEYTLRFIKEALA